ncbi:FxLYD domain-containing protein [Desertibacillus haloalkaliphilus]|uniref:FxLYD domain-containing protein n=1 Tax=Desertibacillus haloalkaliphilus TaxID=1328930 RepID=UPI001C27B2BC|nr:FxLYD domain-containing protein [Desertibacillus haloalkaliphilus]MBU8906526.1 FxLYD domain-containing protein [Desertibacillus haloalkaliphilus]
MTFDLKAVIIEANGEQGERRMYCHSCGQKRVENAQFCSNCGTEFVDTDAKKRVEEKQTDQDQTSSSRAYQWFIPVVSMILIGFGLGYFYITETNKNEQVHAIVTEVDQLLSESNYSEAASRLSSALHTRPEHVELEQFMLLVEKASQYEQDLLEVDSLLQEKSFDEASENLLDLNAKLNEETNELYQPLHTMVQESEDRLTVALIRDELDELTTYEQLATKLSEVSSVGTEGAGLIKEQIITKIVDVTYEQASALLQQHDFSGASNHVEKGLQHAADSEKLLNFREKIEHDQIAFQQAEQQRIEQAMIAAAEEDLKNRTDAVEVVSMDSNLDEWGDLYFHGEIKNTATKPIYSVELYASVYDHEGIYLGGSLVSVYPYYIEPGEVGYFSGTFYGVYENMEISIEDATWYLD